MREREVQKWRVAVSVTGLVVLLLVTSHSQS
jgi:hypothetical protein